MKKSQKSKYEREIQAYGAFDDSNNLLYATVKPSRELCVETLHRFNPRVEGHHYPYKVLPIFIGVDLNTQNDLFADEEKP